MMHIQNSKWENADKETILCECDGTPASIPADPANRHYAEIMRQVADEGLVIAEPN